MRTILSALLFSTLALSATARADEAKPVAPVEAAKPAVKHSKKTVVKSEVKTEAAKPEVTPVVAKSETKTTKVESKVVAAPKVQPRKVNKIRRSAKPKMPVAAPKTEPTQPQPAK